MSCYLCAGKIFKIEILNVFLYEKRLFDLNYVRALKHQYK